MPADENTSIRSIALNPDQKLSQYIASTETIDLSNKEHLYVLENANKYGADISVPVSQETAYFALSLREKYAETGAFNISVNQISSLPAVYTVDVSQSILRNLVADFKDNQIDFRLDIPLFNPETNENYLGLLLASGPGQFWEDYSKFYGPDSKELAGTAKFLIKKACDIKYEDKYNHSAVIHEATHATEFDLGEKVKQADDLRRQALGTIMTRLPKNLSKEGTVENSAYKKYMNDAFKMSVITEVRAIFNELSCDTDNVGANFSPPRTSFRLLHLMEALKTDPRGSFCSLESSLRNLQRENLFTITGSAPHQIAMAIMVLGEEYFDSDAGFPTSEKVLGDNKTGSFNVDTALVSAEIANKIMIATSAIYQGKSGVGLTESFYAKIEQSLLDRADKLKESSSNLIEVLKR